jgi:hypothetical protein
MAVMALHLMLREVQYLAICVRELHRFTARFYVMLVTQPGMARLQTQQICRCVSNCYM